MNSPDAPVVIAHLVETLGHRLNIGAGTVCTSQDLDLALAAGAQFIVTPILDEEVIRTCVKKEVPVFPGAYTPTEIYRAWSLGASMVKVFPATQLGAGYIREVLAPLPAIKLMPTGGVSPDNFADFLRAGARGLGMGTQLFPKQLIAEGRWEELGEFFSRFVKAYCDFKEQKTTQQQ
jgi:2-dehydro-3-deoxyphosphogluconate aldolase/(4S)-4-hydroxy-2-oxoglutarate aldolase